MNQEFTGVDLGLINRMQKITGNPSAQYPKTFSLGDIVPMWNYGRPYEENLTLFFVGPTANSDEPSVLFNDDELIAKINGASALRINGYGCLATGGAATWNVQSILELNLSSATDTIATPVSERYDVVGAGDLVRLTVMNANRVFNLRQTAFNNDAIQFQSVDVTSLLFRGERHTGSGTGTFSNLTIDISLLY